MLFNSFVETEEGSEYGASGMEYLKKKYVGHVVKYVFVLSSLYLVQ